MQGAQAFSDVRVLFGEVEAMVVEVFSGLKAGSRLTRVTVRVPPAENAGPVALSVQCVKPLRVRSRAGMIDVEEHATTTFQYTEDGRPVIKEETNTIADLGKKRDRGFVLCQAENGTGGVKVDFGNLQETFGCDGPRAGKGKGCGPQERGCEVPDVEAGVRKAAVATENAAAKACDRRCQVVQVGAQR